MMKTYICHFNRLLRHEYFVTGCNKRSGFNVKGNPSENDTKLNI